MRSPSERSAAPDPDFIHPTQRSQATAAAEGVGSAVAGAPAARDESLQLRALFRASAALVSAVRVEEVAEVVADQVVPALGAAGGALVVHEDGETVTVVGEGEASPWARHAVPLSQASPITDAIRRGAPVLLETDDEWHVRYPALQSTDGGGCVAVIPCAAGSTAVGAIVLGFAPPRHLSEDDVAFALALAQLCGRALERAALYRREAQSRAHLTAVIAGAPVGIVVMEAGGRLVTANPQAYALLSRDQAGPLFDGLELYRPGGGVYPPAEWPIQRSLAGESIEAEEVAFVRADGERRTLVVCASPLRNTSGEIGAAMMVFWDVTERKRREGQYRAAATRMRRLMDSNIIGVATANEHRILDANQLFLDIVGYDREQLRDGTIEWPAISPAEFADADREAIEELRQHGSCRPYEKAFIHRDGRKVPVLVGSALLELMPLEWICFAFDMTDRRLEERRQRILAEAGRVLAQSLELDPTLAALARLAVSDVADLCIVDLVQPDGSVRRASVTHADPARASTVARLAVRGPMERGELGIRATLASGQPQVIDDLKDVLANAKDRDLARVGEELGVASLAILPLTARGRVLGTLTLASTAPGHFTPAEVALAAELADRAALAIDHAQLYLEAQQAAREREEMVAIVSHDLRSPLNTISMASSLLLVPELPLEKKLIQSGVIRRSVDRMSRLIQDLLDVTRLGAGQLQVHLAAESVRVLLDDAAAAALPLAEAKRIHLEVLATTPRATRVQADRERILQVLSNLLDNAIRFTPEEGSITLSAGRDGGMVRFTVADTGSGISPEELPHVFDRFWQGRRQERDGAGLGLAIVRGLVEAHGGTIDVRSTLSAGTAFMFTLPIA